ncbi:MAG: hypothetical protein AAF431_07150 [Pseudomonadota bacterium]
MNNSNNVNLSRRKALLGTATGAAAVAAWHKPLVNAVVLPAHAQMTTMNNLQFFGTNVGASPTTKNGSSPLDLIITPAVAGMMVEQTYTIEVIQTDTEGQTFEIGVFEEMDRDGFGGVDIAQVVYRGPVSVGETKILPVTENPCGIMLKDFNVEIAQVNIMEGGMSNIVLNFPNRLEMVTVPEDNQPFPTAGCILVPLADSYYDPMASSDGGLGMQTRSSTLDFIIGSAHAQEGPATFGLLAERTGPNATTYTVSHLNRSGDVLRSAILDIDGTTENLLVIANACEEGEFEAIPAAIVAVDQSEMEIRVDFQGERGTQFFTIPAASGSLMAICIRDD